MSDNLSPFTPEDLKHGVKFSLSDFGNTQYEIYMDQFNNTWIHPVKSNEVTAQVNRIVKKGFYWSKFHFGKTFKGFHPFTALQKVEKKKGKEVPNV